MTDDPDEVVTLAYCPACEVLSVPADLDYDGDRARCHRCGMAISADDYYDYADLRVVEYD
jgi:uncharacterized paraquat-inducible protein A